MQDQGSLGLHLPHLYPLPLLSLADIFPWFEMLELRENSILVAYIDTQQPFDPVVRVRSLLGESPICTSHGQMCSGPASTVMPASSAAPHPAKSHPRALAAHRSLLRRAPVDNPGTNKPVSTPPPRLPSPTRRAPPSASSPYKHTSDFRPPTCDSMTSHDPPASNPSSTKWPNTALLPKPSAAPSSEDELAAPVPNTPWTAFDYIAHLATIEALINPWFGAMTGAPTPPPTEVPPPRPFDLDEWNEAIVARRHGRTLDDVFTEAAANRAAIHRQPRTHDRRPARLPHPHSAATAAIDLPPVMIPLHDVLTGIALHDPMHTHDILRALPHRATDPAVAAWLATVDLTRTNPEMRARRA